ncbi:uncharacterized protein LOC144992347 [Oryzias latipes]
MAESKNRSFCCVPGCSSSNQKQPYLSFHSFPVDPNLKTKWIQAIRRDEGHSFTVKTGSTFVCSRHFAPEDYIGGCVVRRLKSGVVPSLFPWNNFTAPLRRESVYDRTSKRQSMQLCCADSDIEAKAVKMDHDYVSHPPAGALDEALDYIHDLEAKLQNTGLPPPTLFSRYCASDDQIRFYTKFPSESVFTIFWESIAPSAHRLVYWTKAQRAGEECCEEPSPPRIMPLIDEFLMYSMRVAVGMKEQLIADMFNVSVARVSRVTITWANYLFMMLSSLPIWISREKVKSIMPLKFQRYCPNVRVILDCTEIALETASSLTLQSETFSSYKNRTTLKGLIGVAPNGLVTFISPLYTGCISDKEITRISGVLPLLEPGDDVMADKGFLIQDLLTDIGCKLVIPPFKRSAQFSKEETEQTQAIARLRIIVERVIGRIKSFHIWDSPVPLTLIGSVNQIWLNCCVLANYQGPFCFED